MVTLTLELPKTLDAQLAEAAERQRASKTAVLLEALREYLARQAQDGLPEPSLERPTVAELAGHLIGCIDVEGPTDLSTNKKYMEGFGE